MRRSPTRDLGGAPGRRAGRRLSRRSELRRRRVRRRRAGAVALMLAVLVLALVISSSGSSRHSPHATGRSHASQRGVPAASPAVTVPVHQSGIPPAPLQAAAAAAVTPGAALLIGGLGPAGTPVADP